MRRRSWQALLMSSSAWVFLSCAPVQAQTKGALDTDTDISDTEIVVTARKRFETDLTVPVVLTAIGKDELEKRAFSDLDSLTESVPGLIIAAGGASIQGGQVVIRGIGASETNPFQDQTVSFNIDGVQVARTTVRRFATMDVEQIEVLKGPQALYYGKNSPGGIISIKSADPTSRLTAKASVGYEFRADEIRGEGYVSGPLTETLGARLAVYGSAMKGYLKNLYPEGTIYTPDSNRLPKTKEFAIRGTLKFEPHDRFDARLKVAYGEVDDAGMVNSQERIFCTFGTPQLGGGPDDCEANGKLVRPEFGTVLGSLDSRFPADGEYYLALSQFLASLEMNYEFNDYLTLASVTGLYDQKMKNADTANIAFSPNSVVGNAGSLKFKEISQEFRLTSHFDGPINFMIGGHYQKSKGFNDSIATLGTATPALLLNFATRQKGEAYSGFAQLSVKPVEVIEISAGGRYSHEKKRLPFIASGTSYGNAPELAPNPAVPRKDSWNDFSPEVTVAFRPTPNLTAFGSYKEGFLSGGFNVGAGTFNTDVRYDQQTIKGFEGGIKSALFGRRLRADLSAFNYKVHGLAVSTTSSDANGIPRQTITNAGKVRIRGVELDLTYRAPIDGLTLRGAVAYNDAEYLVFNGGCYRGQTQAMGCNVGLPNAAGRFSVQDLSGTELIRAPEWSGNVGFDYESRIGNGLKLALNGMMTFSSSYLTEGTSKPQSRQKGYELFDATVAIADVNEVWEVAVIGRNLTDKYYVVRAQDVNQSGSQPGGTTGTLGDSHGAVNRGRQILVRLTWRFGR